MGGALVDYTWTLSKSLSDVPTALATLWGLGSRVRRQPGIQRGGSGRGDSDTGTVAQQIFLIS